MLAGGDSIGVVRDEGRRVPAAVELDGEVGDSGLGDLAAVVDQNDVIDGGMATGPGGVGLATGRLVVEPTLVWVDGLEVHRQSDGPGGAHRAGPSSMLTAPERSRSRRTRAAPAWPSAAVISVRARSGSKGKPK